MGTRHRSGRRSAAPTRSHPLACAMSMARKSALVQVARIAFVVALLIGCRGDGDAATKPGLAVSDSVPEFALDSAAPFLGFAAGLAHMPDGVIAGYEGVLLSDHLAAVANYDHVLLYDARTDSAQAIGRKGSGPGEFRRLNHVYHVAGGFLTSDNIQRRLSFFRSSGEFDRSVIIETGTAIGWLDGTGPVTRRGGFTAPTTYRSHDSVGRLGRDLITLPAPPVLHVTTTSQEGTEHLFMGSQCDPPVLAAVIGHTLFVADQKTGRVLAVSADGTSRVAFVSPRKSRVTTQVHERVKSTYARVRPAERDAVLEQIGDIGDSLYVTWDQMIPDVSGRIWLRFSGCVNERPRIWDIMDTSGTHRGTVRTDLHIVAAYDRSVLVRGEDSIGTPELAIWKLVPP